MATASDRPPILPPNPAGVPEEMRRLRRWAPWRAEWNEKKQKYVKIPHRAARPEYGLSNKNQAGWVTFDEAMAVYKANPDKFAGVGYLMTGPHGVTGIDLDHCRDPRTGAIDEWALEIAAKLDSYTEVSPSGTGLHIMVADEVPSDWTNHDRGIEVYGGNEARFLCVTGALVLGAPDVLRAPRAGVMDGITATYRKAEKVRADVEDLHLPELIPVEYLPTLAELELPPHARNFLTEGPDLGRDRSQQLFAAAIALVQAGLQRDEVLSILEANEYAMEIALDHRRQDYDKALRYLWKEHCRAAATRAAQIRDEGVGAFDDLEPVDQHQQDAEAGILAPSSADVDDFDVLPEEEADPRGRDLGPVRKTHFPLLTPGQFLKRKPLQWIVRGLLPRAGLAVIFGASTAGKTFFTLDLVLAISRGVEWAGRRVTQGRGVYIVAEGAEGFRNRIQAYCEFHDVDPDSLAVHVLPAAPTLMDKAEVKELILDLKTLGPLDYVVIDTYARVMVGGNENDAKDAGVMVDHCARIHKHTGAMVILVHHSGVNTEGRARGSSVLKAAADVEIEVLRTREYRAAKVAKMKDGDDSGEFRFNLHTITLGQNEDGDDITSCVLEHRDSPPPGAAPERDMPKGSINQTVITTINDLVDLAGDPNYNDAVEACVSQLPHEEGKRDRRRELVVKAIDRLAGTGHLVLGGGKVAIG
jgi:hypothetical protein